MAKLMSAERFEQLLRGELRGESPRDYAKCARTFLGWMEDNKRKELTSDALFDFFIWLQTRSGPRKGGGTWKPAMPRTIKLYRTAIKRYCEKCDPDFKFPKIKCPRVGRTRYKYLTKADYIRLYQAAETPLERAMVSTAYSTGMRIGELITRKMAHLQAFDAAGSEAIYVDGKVDLDANIPLDDRAVADLRAYFASMVNEGISLGPNDYIFWYEGKPLYNPDTQDRGARKANRVWHRILKRAGITVKRGEEFGWHVLRHTRATHLRMDNTPIEDIKDLLRHSSLATTMIYAEIDTENLRKKLRGKNPLGNDKEEKDD